MAEPKLWQLTAGSAVLGLIVAAVAAAAAGPWDAGQRRAERDRAAAHDGVAARPGPAAHAGPAPAPSAPGVLTALSGRAPAAAEAVRLKSALGPLMNDPALGAQRSAAVVDVATGRQLYGRAAGTPMTPASTVKLATTAAALSALGPGYRIRTTVEAGRGAKELTLVGGGDATLDDARLGDLADDTAGVLRKRGVSTVILRYDTSLYSGPREHPISPNDNIAPVTALMTGEGRLDGSAGGPAPRSGDPAGDAAGTFAGLLRERGIRTASAPVEGKPAKGAATIATTYSEPLSDLVERTLTESDNDIAESLARQTAIGLGEPASFAGGGRAVLAQLKKMKLPLTGARFADGSGLNRADKVTASLLAGLLARSAGQADPELRPILTGLPVAGFTGTLRGRYGDAEGAAGLIRAKTGTLTGVNTLAGTVVDGRGRLLAFAFLAGSTRDPAAAEAALDRLSSALVH